jgi:hypothetical protein
MKWMTVIGSLLVVACVNSPPIENPSSPSQFRGSSEQASEARQLEKAEADCAAQGKHAVARRVEGTTLYDCVSSQDAASSQ